MTTFMFFFWGGYGALAPVGPGFPGAVTVERFGYGAVTVERASS